MLPPGEIIGAVAFSVMTVRPGDTSVALGVGDLPIVDQSQLLNLMEHAAVISLDEYLEPGETTISISTELISLSPASIGAELRATSRCIEVDNRELTFECEIYEGERQVAAAMIKRATVERVSFLARTAAQSLIS
ncbi:MAG: thioesterase family protein [Candidatus Planktophila sp.]